MTPFIKATVLACSVAAFSLLATACGADREGSAAGDSAHEAPSPCEASLRPIVFAHGFIEEGDAFAAQSMRFASNGYCLERIYAFDWNTLGSFSDELRRFELFVDRVLQETGADQIDLVGHSMGTFLSTRYLSNPLNAAKVAHYAALAGAGGTAPPGGVPTLTVSSEGDYVAGVSDIPGATNIHPAGLDHLQVATSAETFANMYAFFNEGTAPSTVNIAPSREILLSGRLVTFAENQPAGNLEMRLYPVDPDTGKRLQTTPAATFTSDDQGFWGPFRAVPGRHYEYEILSNDGFSRPLHYYREPYPRSCRLLYFRVFPPPLSLPGIVLGLLPYSDEYALLATLNLNQAVCSGRDTLYVDGYEISTPRTTPAEQTVIAAFYFDADRNGSSDGPARGGLITGGAFFQVFDLRIDTSQERPVPVQFNGRMNAVRNWKSDSQGVTIAVFE